MQLRKLTLIAAFGALTVLTAGCGDDDEVTTCTQDSDCGGNEQCVTGSGTSGVCAQNCSADDDCDSGFRCLTLNPDGVTDGYCGCDSDASCAEGQTCSTLATCVTDDGSGGGGNVGSTCSGTGRSTCSYGDVCTGGTCADVPAPTCANYNAFPNKSVLGTTGNIIFSGRVVSSQTDATFCPGASSKRVRVGIEAYSDTEFPANKDDLNGLFYVTVDGSQENGDRLISTASGSYTRSENNRRADMVLNFCVAPSVNSLSLGFYFTQGNFFCYQASGL